MSLAVGSRLGPYEIVGPLGAGGMGEVYRARDTKLHRDVALKVLPVAALGNPSSRARLVREARLAASLNHPSICTVHDVDESDGGVYVAMELIEGRPLAESIGKDGLPGDQLLRYGEQIADALAHAHERGIVHRDLKAANVAVTADGRVKVLDFGLAARWSADVEDATRSAASLESPGVVVGTLPYMAPEALRGESVDPRSDVWSLGVLLYEMAAGRRPFSGKSAVDLTSSILRDSPPALPPGVAPGLAAVIDQCLQKERGRRYKDGAQVRAALSVVHSATHSVVATPHRQRRIALAVGALALTAAAAAGLMISGVWRTSSRLAANRPVPSIPAADSQAYELYLRGRFHAGRESPEEIAQAIDFFERAVAADPKFAAAHAELARAYGQRLFYVTPGDMALQERAFVEIERALALDPTLDTAHLARGLLLWQPWNHFPHERAIAAYRRAIALNPKSDEAHHQLGLVYIHVGLLDQAKREIDDALRLNPANTLAQFREGVIALYGGRYAEAADVFKATPPTFQPPLRSFQLADSLFHLGRKGEARATVDSYLQTTPKDLGGVNNALSALLAADAGDIPRLEAFTKKAQEAGRGFGHFHHTAFTIARAYATVGRVNDAIAWLRNAADDGYPCYPVFENDRTLDRIRAEQAFKDFLAAQRSSWEAFKRLAQ